MASDLGTNVTSIIFLCTILALVVFLAVSKRGVIRTGSLPGAVGLPADGIPAVLVVLDKVEASAPLLEAVRQRVMKGAASFFVLVPNPDHLRSIASGRTPATAAAAWGWRSSRPSLAPTAKRRPGRN